MRWIGDWRHAAMASVSTLLTSTMHVRIGWSGSASCVELYKGCKELRLKFISSCAALLRGKGGHTRLAASARPSSWPSPASVDQKPSKPPAYSEKTQRPSACTVMPSGLRTPLTTPKP